MKGLDDFLTSKIRSLFNLYSSTTRLIIYLPRVNGGIGIKKLSHVYYSSRITLLLKMLNHKEDIFRNIAKNSLKLDMEKRGVPSSLDDNNFLGYKVKDNGFLHTTTKYGCESDWHDLNVYSRKLGILIQWHDNKASLKINDKFYHDYRKINEVIKSFILKKQLEKGKSLSLQGSFFLLENIDNKNSHTIYYN